MILGFQKQFVPAVVAGTKPHSIRAGQRWREGMSIQFYQGSYHQKRDKFRPDGVALVVQEFELELLAPARRQWVPHINGRPLTPLESQELARRDGFDDYKQLLDWFWATHGLPFYGQLIIWQPNLRY